jgi:hypothetical protein
LRNARVISNNARFSNCVPVWSILTSIVIAMNRSFGIRGFAPTAFLRNLSPLGKSRSPIVFSVVTHLLDFLRLGTRGSRLSRELTTTGLSCLLRQRGPPPENVRAIHFRELLVGQTSLQYVSIFVST